MAEAYAIWTDSEAHCRIMGRVQGDEIMSTTLLDSLTIQIRDRLDSDGVKLFGTTISKNIADRAIQVLGGYGYVGEYIVERWRDAKLLEIVVGP